MIVNRYQINSCFEPKIRFNYLIKLGSTVAMFTTLFAGVAKNALEAWF